MRFSEFKHMFLQFGFALLLSLLGGCNKVDEMMDLHRDSDMTITVSTRNASGEITMLEEGVTLGMTTASPDYYQAINIPYKLMNGVPTPVKDEIKFEGVDEDYNPENYTSLQLYVYGPYTPSAKDFVLNPVHPSGPADPSDQTYPPYLSVNLYFGVKPDQRSNGTASSDLIWGYLPDFKDKGNKNNIVLNHKFCKIKIKLTSELGNDLSDAKVTLLSMLTGGQLKFYDGSFNVSREDAYRSDITAFHNPDGTYDVVIPPQEMLIDASHILVETSGKTYTFRHKGARTLEEGKEYLFELTVKDKGDLPFTITVTYDNGKTLGDNLVLPARQTTYDISMREIPNAGKNVTYTKIRIRNASGEHCWARIENDDYSTKDVIYDRIIRTQIIFEENLSPTPRSMVMEFYNTVDTKFTHKRVLVEQAAATNYFTLSSASLIADRWGHVYDFPQRLSVQSNKKWTIENSAPDWVTVEGYDPNVLNQELHISLKENTTGKDRKGEIRFLTDGVVVKSFPITQTIVENVSFALKYELNLRYNTTENKWHKIIPDFDDYYAAQITIFAKYEDNPDTAAAIYSDAMYGYVTDAPKSFNSLAVDGFKSNYFIYPNYQGMTSQITGVNSTISGPPPRKLTIFRQIIFNLPIPANVKRNQKVVYTVTINNIQDTKVHDTATVTYEIIKQ